MRIPWKKLILLVATLISIAVAKADKKTTFPLLDGKQEAVIVVDKISPPPPLATYIEKSTGRRFRTILEKDYDPKTTPYAIFVGNTKKARELFGKELKEMGIDDYIVHITPKIVILTGATPETQAWAQYDFLREYMDIDSYFPHELGLVIPKHDKVLIPVGTRLEKPAYQNRAWWGFNPQVKKENFSQGVIPWRLPSIEQRGPMAQHTIQKLITVKEYGKTHPEYFPMVDGKRKLTDSGHKQAPCISNPSVIKIVIEKLRKYFDEHPKEKFFALGMTDGGYCECPECKAMDGPAIEIPGCETDSSYSQRWYTFLNQVAAAIAKSHPGRIITTLAYAKCDLPPKNIPVERNIMPFLCFSHSTLFDPEVKRVNLAITDAWLKRLDQIGIYEYYYGASLAIPMIYTHDMADYLRHVYSGSRSKQVGFFAEVCASWGMDGPKCWILEKLLWNPNQNVDQLTQEWCDNVFQEASPAMVRYFNELEKMRVKNGKKLIGITEYTPWKGKAEKLDLQNRFGLWQKSCQLLLFPPEDVERCQKILEEARDLTQKEIVKKRIDYFADTFKLTEYASKTYDAYKPLSKLLFNKTTPTALMEKLIEGDAKAPSVDALEFAQQLLAEDHTKFNGPAISLAGCGLAVRKIIHETAEKAINKALKEGERDREKLVDIGLDALKANAPGQEYLVTPAGKKRMDILADIVDRVATAKRIKKAPVIDGKTDENVWKWVDQSPWFNWKSIMPNNTKTKFAFAHDGQYLYLALRCPQDDLAKHKKCPKKYGAPSFKYPSVEFFLSTDQPSVDKKDLTFYQAVPAYGGGFSEHGGGKYKYDHKAVKSYAITSDAGEWRAEMKIDLKKLGLTPDKYPWLRINFVRNRGAGGFAGCSWFPSPAAHKEQESRGWLVFESEQNLLKNGSFEQWHKGSEKKKARPIHWHEGTGFERDKTEKSDGESAITWSYSHQDSIAQRVQVIAGHVYQLSMDAKYNLAPWYFMVSLKWTDKTGKQLGQEMKLYSGLKNWHEIVLNNLVAPQNAKFVTIRLGPYASWGKKRRVNKFITVDNIRFAEVPANRAENLTVYATVPLVDSPEIMVDGKHDDTAWKNAVKLRDFFTPEELTIPPDKSEVKLLADKNNIYCFATLQYPEKVEEDNGDESHDKLALKEDILELFFDTKPTADTDHDIYQFMIKPSGVSKDLKSRWLNGKTPNATIATSKQDKYWTVEMKIPVKELGLETPLDDKVKILAQFARRNDVQKSSSTWQPLKEPMLQARQDWGEIGFGKNTPRIDKLAIYDDELNVEISNPENKATDVNLSVEELKSGNILSLTEDVLSLPAESTNKPFATPVKKMKNIYWVSMRQDGKLLRRIAFNPLGQYAAIDIYDPESVLGNKLYLAENMRSFKPFKLKSNFPGKQKGGVKRLYRRTKAIDLIFDLPEGVEATSYDCSGWGVNFEPLKPALGKSSVKNGVKYQEYIFELPCISDSQFVNMAFFKTNWNRGDKGIAYARLRWAEGEQIPNAMPIEIIAIPQVPRFRRTPSRWDYMSPEFAYQWHDDPANALPDLGISAFPLDTNPGKSVYVGTKINRKAIFDRIIGEMRKTGMYFIIQNGWEPKYWKWTGGKDADPEASFIKYDGTKRKAYGCDSYCYTYRGRYYQEWVNRLANSYAVKAQNATWLILDLEYWGHDACCCQRCLKQYASWCEQENKKTTFGDPREFLKDEEKNVEAVKQWKEFTNFRFRKMFTDIRNDVFKNLPKDVRWTGPYPRPLISEWRRPNLALGDAVDYFDYCVYYHPESTRTRITEILTQIGNRYKHFAAALAPTPCWPQNQNLHPRDNIYNIFEMTVARNQGFEWWCTQLTEMLNVKYMAEGYAAISPFEDIYLDGTVIPTVKTEGANATARAITNKDETLLYVRDYNVDAPVEVKALVANPSMVYDTRTGEKLGQTTRPNEMISVKLSPEMKGRLLYCGNRYDERIAKAKKH